MPNRSYPIVKDVRRESHLWYWTCFKSKNDSQSISTMRWVLLLTTWTFILGWMWLTYLASCDILIIRKVNKKDVYHKDRFNIRRSKCTNIRQGNKCGYFGGFERSPNNPCKCHCPPRRGTIIKKNKRWKCVDNEEFRQQEGCGFYLSYESSDSFVKILRKSNWQSFHAATPECKLGRQGTSYLSCNGSWVDNPNMANRIDFVNKGFDQVARGYGFQVKIRKSRLFNGKLVKLHLNCTPFGGKPCLLVKMGGKQNCFKEKKSNIRNRIQIRTSVEKNTHRIYSPSSSYPNMPLNSPQRTNQPINSWNHHNHTESMEDEIRSRRADMEVTAIILTITAVFLGLIVLGLCVNLCCTWTTKDTHKGKHIFRRIGDRSTSGAQRLRTTSDVTTTTQSISLNMDVSSEKSLTYISTAYRTDCSLSRDYIDQDGIS